PDVSPCFYEVLRRIPSAHPGIADRDRFAEALSQTRLQQTREALLVFHLQSFHVRVAEEQDPSPGLNAGAASHAVSIAVRDHPHRALPPVDRRVHIWTVRPAQCVDRLPDLRVGQDELLWCD